MKSISSVLRSFDSPINIRLIQISRDDGLVFLLYFQNVTTITNSAISARAATESSPRPRKGGGNTGGRGSSHACRKTGTRPKDVATRNSGGQRRGWSGPIIAGRPRDPNAADIRTINTTGRIRGDEDNSAINLKP